MPANLRDHWNEIVDIINMQPEENNEYISQVELDNFEMMQIVWTMIESLYSMRVCLEKGIISKRSLIITYIEFIMDQSKVDYIKFKNDLEMAKIYCYAKN